jgi:hypothetical protein
MSLEDVSPILLDEADCMEQMAARLEQLLPAVRGGHIDEIARTAVNLKEFAGPVEAFQVATADETAARFERARRRLLMALQDPANEDVVTETTPSG